MTKTRVSQLSILLVSFMLGVLLMAQFTTQKRLDVQRALASSADGALLISDLVDANARLRQEVVELQNQRDELRGASRQVRVQAMAAEKERLDMVNGRVDVEGPGVQVTLDGSVQTLDVHDLLNELRNAGAEATALNGHRVLASTVIVPNLYGGIAIDGADLHRPFIFDAIGDPATLESALLRPGGLLAVFEHSREHVQATVKRQDKLVVPRQASWSAFQYAVPDR